ncbi:PVC-type heme-binding CxxCH protein [Planctomycetes bacterium K23_9]|uniref:Carbohydrate acetyl esterase/feruloyl esterase n=1 Tax=Stieleria marina TaxID=1930275 RepID=A0A517NMJ3_9BACT|nr:Carbohydrate acetyl esterase/feruloyl esterase precursor [Planctomycetes bacterium K23_9]
MPRPFVAIFLILMFFATAIAQETTLPTDQKDFHLFLLVGQSNMAGRGKVTDSDRQPVDRVLMLNKANQWVPAVDPLHFDKPNIVGVGPGRSFALRYAQAHPGATVGLIPCAVGGSPIAAWEPGGYHESTKTHPYDDMLPRLKAAMPSGTVKGILWHQGESDSKPQLARVYESKLHTLIKRLRNEIGNSSVPFLAGQLGKFSERPWDENKRRVDAVHQSLPKQIPATEFVSSDGLDHKGDNVHFSAAAAKELGQRYAAAYAKIIERQSDLEWKDGDRVVLLGDGLIEQEQYFGWIEVMLTMAFADREMTFRNLGWSADTPAGDSRFGLSLLQAGREPVDEGFNQLVKQIELTKPTVVVFGYGMASSLEGGPTGVDEFQASFDRLIAAIKKVSPKVRFVFLSPIDRIDGDVHGGVIPQYSDAIEKIAQQNDSPFVDLTGTASSAGKRKDPIHLSELGYRAAASAIQAQLGLKSDWQNNDSIETLRDVILRKNVWWFHRSRPANMAYVFGFRKREQGQNAVEIPKFDDLIAEEEKQIALLRTSKPTALPEKLSRTESKFAKFSEQPTPEFTTGKDLEVTLWAENPQLNKPIQMNFDPQGRLWIASSEAYPMIEVGQAAPDKILILEDTNGDGTSDKSTVFADGLLIPTGVIPGDGGCYVAQSTDLLFLKDTDGDGKADVKKRVLSGFGTEDTHHNLHTLVWGPDGRLYMNQSVYTRTDAETARGVMRLKAGGGFRYNPATMRMEVVFRGLWNPWGHQFDAYGQSFLSDGAGFAGLAYAFPGAAFNPTPKARRVLDLISPGSYPKFCSAEIIHGDSYPPEWQGSIVTCDFRANRVTRFSLAEQDAGFVTKQEDDLLRTSAATFRPIDVKQGPDGALYIADWSNPIINHGEVDFRDERRDRWHGRIWRVSWKGAKKQPVQDFTQLGNEKLFANLTDGDRYVRDQSRRVLLERKSQIVDKVHQWSEASSDEFSLLQAVWLQQGLDQINHGQLQKLVTAQDPKIRAAAMRIVSDFADPRTDVSDPLSADVVEAYLAAGVEDAHPRVRLEAVRGLSKLGTSEAARTALIALNHPRDRFIDFAIAATMEDLTDPFIAALNAGQWKPDTPERENQLAFLLSSIEPRRASEYLASHLSENKMAADGSGPWIELIGKAGSQVELKQLFDQTTSGGFDDGAAVRAIAALSQAQRLRKTRPAGNLAAVTGLLDSDNQAIQNGVIGLIGNWKMASQVDRLAKLAESNQSSAAIKALREIGQPSAKALTRLAGSGDIQLRKSAVVALASLGANRAAKPFYDTLSKLESEQEATELWRNFLNNKGAGKALTSSFPADGISQIAARAGVRAANDGGRSEPDLIAALMPHANLEATIEKLTPERIATLVKKVTSEGDAHRGESVYSRESLACINCHAIGGVGGKVGPDMTSLGASAPLDYLIESVYEPNAKIKENYHSVVVATEDGQTISGIEVESTDDELVIRDANNKLVRVPQDDIVAEKAGKSLMPNGVVDRLTMAEQVDLLKFLSQLGKPGDFDASKGGVGRVYEIFAGTHRIEQQGAERIISGEVKEGWMPLKSRVNGDVPGATLAKMTEQPRHISLVNVYLRTTVDVASDGGVTIDVTGPDKAALWVDAKRIEGENSFKTNLKAGTHTVLIRLDAKALPEAFRLVSRDVSFATQ